MSRTYNGASGLQAIEVTDQFKSTLKLTGADVVTGSFMINAPDNTDGNTLNNIYWDVTRVKIVEGWSYEPTSDIAIPMNYDDALFSDEYSEDGLGGKNSIDILG